MGNKVIYTKQALDIISSKLNKNSLTLFDSEENFKIYIDDDLKLILIKYFENKCNEVFKDNRGERDE